MRDKYKKSLTIKEGVKIVLDIFEKVHGEKFDINKMELVYIQKDKEKIKRLEGKEIKEL